MDLNNEKLTFSGAIRFMGAVLAFAIGAGFATGQELLQYFSAYKWEAIGVGAVFLVIFIVSNYCFAIAGRRGGFTKGSQVFQYYCGKPLGLVFDYFTSIFCYMSFVVMVAGAANTLFEQYGVPKLVGALILGGLACITVIFGLNGIVNIISKIGPFLVGIALIIGLWALVTTADRIPEGMAMIDSGEVTLTKASNNWFMAGASYGGFCLLWFAGFMAELGSKENFKNLMAGQMLSGTFNIVACVLIGFALTASIADTSVAAIPSLVLATNIWPPIAYFYAIIIFLAIYSTSCPLLWTGVSRFSTEGTSKFKILAAVGAALGIVIALYVPYATLLNYIYVLNGYGGFILFAIMVIQEIRYRLTGKTGIGKSAEITESKDA